MPNLRCDYLTYTLGTNLTANGNQVAVPGGEYLFMVDGTASGTTASLQVQMPNGTWSDISVYSGSFVRSTNLPYAQTGIDLPACNVRAALTGGTPTGVNAYLVGLG